MEWLHRAACRLVEAAARRETVSIQDLPLGDLADYPLVGVFITLRKDGALRSCIGNFAEATPLGKALERAACGVVLHDPRFPPVSADELAELTLSLSLLHTREPITGDRDERAQQVTVGQHGLDIQLGGHKGLLLPNVATDHGLGALDFLRAVCQKAQLPEDAWARPDATLYRFSAVLIRGPWVHVT